MGEEGFHSAYRSVNARTDLCAFGLVVQFVTHGDGVVADSLRGASDAVRRQVVAHVGRHPVVVGVARVERIARRGEHRRNLHSTVDMLIQ